MSVYLLISVSLVFLFFVLLYYGLMPDKNINWLIDNLDDIFLLDNKMTNANVMA